MNTDKQIQVLKSASKRVAMVREWCKLAKLNNVSSDMEMAQREIENTISFIECTKSRTIILEDTLKCVHVNLTKNRNFTNRDAEIILINEAGIS